MNFNGPNADWLDGYVSLFHREFLANSGLYQSYAKFITGHALYCFLFDNVSSLSFDHVSRVRSAEARINLIFEAGNTNPNLTLILFTLTDEQIEIDHARNVEKAFIN